MTRQSLIGFGFVILVILIAVVYAFLSNPKKPDAKSPLSVTETSSVEQIDSVIETVESANVVEMPTDSEVIEAVETIEAVVTDAEPLNVKDQVLKIRTLGNPDAPVKMEEFASLTCSHCATFHNNAFPQLKEKYIDTGKVFFTFTDFPLNAPALEASIVARCLPEERYFKFLSFLFETQETWAFDANYSNMLRQNAKLLGATDRSLDLCLKDQSIRQALISRMQKAGQEHNVSSTPSFIINGGAEKISGSQSFESYSAIIEKYLAAAE